MKPIRYGLLSTSSIAPRFVAAVRAAGGGEVVALSSRSLEKARAKAAEWNIPTAYGSHDQLLGDPNVDVVYLSTVNGQHYQWAKAALLAGKHVLCEKPCTTSSRQTRELFALARQRGLLLMEAQKMLFLPAVLALKERVERGDVGKIHLAEFRHSFSPDYNGWMFRRAAVALRPAGDVQRRLDPVAGGRRVPVYAGGPHGKWRPVHGGQQYKSYAPGWGAVLWGTGLYGAAPLLESPHCDHQRRRQGTGDVGISL